MHHFLIINKFIFELIILILLIFLQNNYQILINMIKINSFVKKIKLQNSLNIKAILIKFLINLIRNYPIQKIFKIQEYLFKFHGFKLILPQVINQIFFNLLTHYHLY